MKATLKAKCPVNLWIPAEEVESAALDQIRRTAELPCVDRMAIMPDVHLGAGATIGSVIAFDNAVCPNAVGVDISCSMTAAKTSMNVPSSKHLEAIRDDLLNSVPVGPNSHKRAPSQIVHNGIWNDFDGLTPVVRQHKDRAMKQIGTLGGGNHFIELSVDQNGAVWVVIHSGSRYIGKAIADAHVKIAKELQQEGLPSRDLAYFTQGSPEYRQYLHDLFWAQAYAQLNHEHMLNIIHDVLEYGETEVHFSEKIYCRHNFASAEVYDGKAYIVVRKGAIQARKGQMGVIPGAMGAKSYIVKGKGCREAMCSAPHGAGRVMSRSQAKKRYTFEDLDDSMKGIVCNAGKKTIDEIKHSYKDIDRVIEYSEELVTPVYTLEQLINIKG